MTVTKKKGKGGNKMEIKKFGRLDLRIRTPLLFLTGSNSVQPGRLKLKGFLIE